MENERQYAGLRERFLALLIDALLFCACFFPVTRIVKGVWLMSPSLISPTIGTPNLLMLFTAVIWILWPRMVKWEERASLPLKTRTRNSRLSGEGRVIIEH